MSNSSRIRIKSFENRIREQYCLDLRNAEYKNQLKRRGLVGYWTGQYCLYKCLVFTWEVRQFVDTSNKLIPILNKIPWQLFSLLKIILLNEIYITYI